MLTRVTRAEIPLKFYEDFSDFKLYPLDGGLLGAKDKVPPFKILTGELWRGKGSFMEQYVLMQLLPRIPSSLFYLSPDDPSQEPVFLFQWEEGLVSLCAGGEEERTESLGRFVTEHPGMKELYISTSPYREEDPLIYLPL